MVHTWQFVGRLGLALVVALMAMGGFLRHEAAASSAGQPPFGAKWSFAAKFVCGRQAAASIAGEPPVKPGNYATTITIHNFNYTAPSYVVVKKLIVLARTNVDGGSMVVREPQIAKPRVVGRVPLAQDTATLDDCTTLWKMATLSPGQLLIGYLVILSPVDLDVDAVYTAEVPGAPGSRPTGIAEEVVTVPGKRLGL